MENPDGEYRGDMTIHDDMVFDTEDEARAWIEDQGGFYEDHAVRFRCDRKSSAKMKSIAERIERENAGLKEYISSKSVKLRKSSYVTCPVCGSKLNKNYIDRYCPVCCGDLFAPSTISTIERKQAKIEELRRQYHDEKKKNNRKEKKLLWLVKIEVHG